MQASCGSAINIYATEWCQFVVEFELLRAKSCWFVFVCFFTNGKQKKAGSLYAVFVLDVTCTDCQTQNGSIHGCILATFKRLSEETRP